MAVSGTQQFEENVEVARNQLESMRTTRRNIESNLEKLSFKLDREKEEIRAVHEYQGDSAPTHFPPDPSIKISDRQA